MTNEDRIESTQWEIGDRIEEDIWDSLHDDITTKVIRRISLHVDKLIIREIEFNLRLGESLMELI